MNYIIHSSILIGLCYLTYQLFLKKETFFFFNRWLLLSFLPLAFLLPHLEVPKGWSLKEVKQIGTYEYEQPQIANCSPTKTEIKLTEKETPIKSEMATIPIIEKAAEANNTTGNIKPEISVSIFNRSENISWTGLVKNIYLIGLALFSFLFLVRFLSLIVKIFRHTSITESGFKIITTDQNIAPCSFWNFIFINPNKYDPATYEQIVQHEKIHISEWHTADILLSEILTAVQWFNPFAWLYRKAVENNLEYLTDQLMLTKGTDRQVYQMSLLKISVPHFSPRLATNYNQSFLKKRIIMMNAQKSPVRSSWKYLLVLPILGLSIICLNTVKSVANDQCAQAIEDYKTPTTQQQEQATNIETDKYILAQNEIDSNEIENEITDLGAINNYSAFSISGTWEADIKGNQICLTYIKRGSFHSMRWEMENCIEKSEFSNIPMGTNGEFTLTRDAGTMTFNGKFENGNGKGKGDYSFSADQSFESYLEKEGVSNVSEETLFYAFINNVNKNYVAQIKQLGLKMDSNDFDALSHFGTSIEDIKTYSRDLKKIGYNDFTLQEIAQLDIHGASMDYIKEMHQLGFKNLTLEKMVQASIHNVTPEYFRELKAAGLEDIEFEDLIQFAIHNIEPGYVKEMQNLSSRKLTNEDIIQAGIHNVSVEYFDELKATGMGDMSLEELVQFSIHNISPSYVKQMQNLSGRKLSSEDIIQAGIHNVTPEYFDQLKEAGMGDMSLEELVQFSIHNISPSYVKQMQNLSGRKLSSDDIIQAGIHNVTVDYFDELKEVGLQDMSLEELVQFSIHDIRPKFITDIKKLGYQNLTNEEIIQAGIHGVTGEYISSLQAVGIKNEPIRKIIEARIHDVTADFINKAKANSDKKDLTLDDYIEMKIMGRRRSH